MEVNLQPVYEQDCETIDSALKTLCVIHDGMTSWTGKCTAGSTAGCTVGHILRRVRRVSQLIDDRILRGRLCTDKAKPPRTKRTKMMTAGKLRMVVVSTSHHSLLKNLRKFFKTFNGGKWKLKRYFTCGTCATVNIWEVASLGAEHGQNSGDMLFTRLH